MAWRYARHRNIPARHEEPESLARGLAGSGKAARRPSMGGRTHALPCGCRTDARNSPRSASDTKPAAFTRKRSTRSDCRPQHRFLLPENVPARDRGREALKSPLGWREAMPRAARSSCRRQRPRLPRGGGHGRPATQAGNGRRTAPWVMQPGPDHGQKRASPGLYRFSARVDSSGAGQCGLFRRHHRDRLR